MQPRNEYLEEKNCKNNNFSGVLPPSRTHTLKKDAHFKSSDMKNQRMPHLMSISGSDINRTFYSHHFTLYSPHYRSLFYLGSLQYWIWSASLLSIVDTAQSVCLHDLRCLKKRALGLSLNWNPA